MGEQFFDVAVVGGGPGGYVLALRCAQGGLKTALIERAHVGGTCLNIGCIPSKALLHSTELFHTLAHKAAANGIVLPQPAAVDLAALHARKNAVVEKLRSGVQMLLSKREVTLIQGEASFITRGRLNVRTAAETVPVTATHIVWASGARPASLAALPFDGQRIVSSNEALAFDRVPETLAVVGAGAIGLELGSVWARLGTRVTLVETLPQIAPGFDPDVAAMAERLLKRLTPLAFETGARVTGFDAANLFASKNGKDLAIPAEKILVCVGRTPETHALSSARIPVNERGQVIVDEYYRTPVEGLYAIGDIIAGPMLAHKAEADAERLAALLTRQSTLVDLTDAAHVPIPAVVYTAPELALIGLTETQANAQGRALAIGKFPFAANGRALTNDAPEGFVKLLADAETQKILGAQILGAGAGELIALVGAHMAHHGTLPALAHTIIAHPTLSESIKEAALCALGTPLHTL